MTRATAEEEEEAGREKRREKREREKRVVEEDVEGLCRQTRRGRYRMSLLRTQLATRDWLGVEVR